MAATLSDIAQRTGLSVSTVSRVLNDKAEEYRISNEAKQLVLDAAKKLNYRPNPMARGLKLKKTMSIGLVVPDLANPFFAQLTSSIQGVAYELGYSLIVCSTNDNIDLEEEHVRFLWSKSVDGMIVIPVGLRYAHFENIVNEELPLVLLDRYFEELKVPAVVADNYDGASRATTHILEQGHKRIAFIQGLPGTSTNTERLRGYKAALEKYGIPFAERFVVGEDYNEESGYEAVKSVLDMNDSPTALFTTSDVILLGALKALDERELGIPKDISLATFDDIDFASYLKCPITAVAQPKKAMGKKAVEVLIEQVERGGGRQSESVKFSTDLIVRRSVGRCS